MAMRKSRIAKSKAESVAETGVLAEPADSRVDYSDGAMVHRSFRGFIISFVQSEPLGLPSERRRPAVRLVSRVGVSPQHFKAIVKMLNRSLGWYEKKFGEIPVEAVRESER